MPYKAKKPCRWSGCPELTNETYCEVHKKKNSEQYDKYFRDPKAADFYHSSQWQSMRKTKLGREPFCEICKQSGRLELAKCVDHIVEIKNGGGALDINNLQSLCQSCHSRKTLQERTKNKSFF